MQRLLLVVSCVVTVLSFGVAGQAQKKIASAPPPAAVTGSGTANHIPLWTGSVTLGNSVMFQTSNRIGIGTTTPTVRLDVNGTLNVSKTYRMGGLDVLAIRGEGGDNFSVGIRALSTVTTGYANTAVGLFALDANNGVANTAVGDSALASSVGLSNTAVGALTLDSDTTGSWNTAIGDEAMRSNISGVYNTAVGADSLHENTTGNNNIAIGLDAALHVKGSNSGNIHIGNRGAYSDNRAIRIGTVGTQSSFFAAGINGETTGLNDAVPVVVDSRGQLGTVSSSRRFKEDIQDMGDSSEGLLRLRPVTFRYQKAFADGSKPIQYGLIAEEVAETYPDLVTHSADGQVETVKYQVLDSMLLNEVQRQQKEIQSLQERLAKMEAILGSTERTK
jgi:hypothetical protein